MRKMISVGLLAGGLLLLYFGYQDYQSFSSEVTEFITGSPDSQAMWMMIGGTVAAVAGLVGLLPRDKI
ncbi:DUF3185 family protein [Rhodohalobacter mucosus]|uniref:DUF3185 family protein n=1 Tax=Rhodohalobacter mucosus TaxID=2079485 RepID=A0A316TXA8_9BACT|nr:DUF3185 family protein [Rhodohalobacter mucosus]PWN07234.1 hypothetical protein DDZ15_05390 [Rhodohalobacter mucosus]